ncbi:hypothetical protein [Polyangium spumosum]|uniref:Uncharacterized protein n=1 Tax=Polyangium spumosum TaxID=889282 RepID=A0A6N7Q0Z7_9BACT|nr:hypothetical protein [Polyangium spumosum]MRG94641.1 hypothetical protein [Polyangium spumosum]
MDRLTPEDPEVARIDNALAEWRQGDVVRGPVDFIHMGDPARPLTKLAGEAQGDGPTVLVGEEIGLVVLTQTCDLVRTCVDRPFVEVAPIVEVDESKLPQIERGYLLKYAHIPALQEERLVADLDRVMTIEKSIISDWVRIPGCRNDAETRAFAEALRRKRGRFAFPDDFVEASQALQKRLKDKHDKGSEEGQALRALREIRVTAAPSWNEDQVRLTFWFIRNPDQHNFAGKPWDEYLQRWLALFQKTDRLVEAEGLVVTLADMSAQDYVESDPLDLDHLSLRGQRAG